MSRSHRPTAAPLAVCLASLTLAGCQGFIASSNTPLIRIIDASPDAPMLDVYQGQSALSYNLAFGNITSYIATSPGTVDLAANTSGSRQLLTATHEDLASGQYTLLVGNNSKNLQQLLLKDQSTPAPTGHVALRFVDQVTAPLAFDIYLVPPGTPAAATSPVLTDQTFNGNSGYLNIPAGPYRIVLYPTGIAPSTATPAAYSGATVTYPSGAVRTIILLDQKIPLRPSVQIVTAADVEPLPKLTSAP